MKKIALQLSILMVAIMVITGTEALAVSYYQAGLPTNTGSATTMQFGYYNGSVFSTTDTTMSGTRAIRFQANQIYQPGADALLVDGNNAQTISGIYTLSSAGGNIWNLHLVSGADSYVRVTDGGTAFMTAHATASQLQLGATLANPNVITWSAVTNVSFNNTIGSSTLTEMAAASSYAFTSFTFESMTDVNSWLSGTLSGGNARYYSQLTGFEAAPEPAEWILIMIGLTMTGFYLHRRGILKTGPASGAAA